MIAEVSFCNGAARGARLHHRLLVVAFVSALLPALAQACGVCAEDKMAATYDHAVVERALAQQRIVVFCEVRGSAAAAQVRAAAVRVRGVDPRSVRTSSDPAALSFAIDPRQLDARTAVRQLQMRMGTKAQLILLKTLPAMP